MDGDLKLKVSSNAQLATIATGQATASITDNDGVPRLFVADIIVSERQATADFVLTLDRPSGLTVKVDVTTRDGSARQPSDYQTTQGTIQFDPGVTQQIFSVPLGSPDSSSEALERFSRIKCLVAAPAHHRGADHLHSGLLDFAKVIVEAADVRVVFRQTQLPLEIHPQALHPRAEP